jgi:hypothetical protein
LLPLVIKKKCGTDPVAFTVMLPLLLRLNRVVLPEVIVNTVGPTLTLADMLPVPILNRLRSITLLAEIFVIPPPLPKKDPLKEPVKEPDNGKWSCLLYNCAIKV